ncbi:hypothetical protein J3S90_04400 [Flavobacterium sp. P4023]|uniref:Host attachment protein n=1 Tax=Flavobacterium flabelliforme TaxID=2816119 RepID=A0ABS5CQZ4_9FLAO|nr:hypothetical protein [Flavobacterium flabelliforme]MBP4141036.1 hypothetical protein [Flavobacterium flabelliforme]
MKKQAGIWIDSTKAIIVILEEGIEKTTTLQSDLENRVYHDKEGDKGSFFGNQHMDSQNTFDERIKHQTNAYLKEVIATIKDCDEIYIFGPAETKTKLEKKIQEEKSIFSGKLKAVEAAENMTLKQIIAKVKHFYTP